MAHRQLLVLDTSYSLETIRANRLEASVTCRDLGGYFERVWTVHPFATLVTSPAWTETYGRPVETDLAPRHSFIEGKVGRFEWLSAVPLLNFLLAQAGVLLDIIRLVRRQRISVVRAGDPLLMGLYGWLVARSCGIPLVVRVCANNEMLRRQTGRPMMPRLLRSARIERAIERFVLSRADLVAGGNEDTRQFALAMGAPPHRTTLFRVGNLVDRRHFVPPGRRPCPERTLAAADVGSRRFLLCISRLEPMKMPDHPIEVLARVRAAGHDVALVMVGGGSLRAALGELAQRLGVADHVLFAGERSQEWLAEVLPAAGVILSPITGRALCEAALAGVPVVAYDVDWQGELIQEGAGALVPNADVDAMAAAAIRFLADTALARRSGAALRERALEMMDPERLDAHERSAYTRLLDGRAS